MSQAKSPQAKIRCCMRNRAQGVFDCVNCLMNKDLANWFFFMAMPTCMRNWYGISRVFGCHFQSQIDIAVLPDDLIVLLSRHHDVNWLAQQHPWDAEKADEHESSLQGSLKLVHVFVTSGQNLRSLEKHHVNKPEMDE